MAKKKNLDIVKALAEMHQMQQKDAEKFIAMLFDVVNDGLQSDKQVKVKGLGTFKIAAVKDRESVNVNTGERVLIEGHDKISFTPDAAMRDRVNKPFAQFETVIVKEGVDFSDLDMSENQQIEGTEMERIVPVAAMPPHNEERTAQSETPDTKIDPAPEHPQEQLSEAESDGTPLVEVSPSIYVKMLTLEKEVRELHQLIGEVESLREEIATLRKKNRRNILLALLLFVVAFVIGFFVGRGTADTGDSSNDSTLVQVEEVQIPSVQAPQTSPETGSKEKESDEQALLEKYNSDPRIKYGAYEIVGIDTVLPLRPGQTMQSICNAKLGSGMISYFEVVNDSVTLKSGKVKVPKVAYKKRNSK